MFTERGAAGLSSSPDTPGSHRAPFAAAVLAVVLFGGGMPSSAHAATGTWTGAAGATWDTTTANWSNLSGTPWDITNGGTNAAVFNTAGATATVSGTVYANSITFNNTATISNGTINLAGTAPTITTATSGTISSLIVGTAGLTKSGAATLRLSGLSSTAADNYSGATTIDRGTLAISSSGTVALSGGLTFGGTAGSTNVVALDLTNASASFSGLTVQTNSTGTNTITIGSGQTLTTNGNVAIGIAAPAVATTNTRLNVTGASGSWIVNNPGGSFLVGSSTNSNLDATVVNLAALGSFTADLGSSGTFRIGNRSPNQPTAPIATLTLAASTNTITTGVLGLGDTTGAVGASTLNLGANATNILNANTINVGFGPGIGSRGNGVLQFSGAGSGSVKIRAADQSSAAALNMISGGISTGNPAVAALFDVTGHSADLLFSTVDMLNVSSPGSGYASTFSFDSGTLTSGTFRIGNRTGGAAVIAPVATVNIGSASNFANTASLGVVTVATMTGTAGGITGNLNISGNATNVTMTSLTIATGSASSSNSSSAIGTVTISGGTTAVNGGVNLASKTNGGTVAGTLNLNGGVLAVAGGITQSSGGYGVVNFNGGILQAGTTSASFLQNVATANVFGGATIDTNGNAVTIAQNLVAGVVTQSATSVTVTAGGSGYANNASMPVTFSTPSGAGGRAASGVAASNGSGVITGITITDPGVGYTAAPTVLTINGSSALGTYTVNTGNAYGIGTTGGGLTKIGSGTLTLSGSNTYTGQTTISAGVLTLGINNTIPNASVVTLGDASSQGTLNMNGFTNSIAGLTFGSAGGTLRLAATSTAASPLTAATGTMTLTNGTLDLAGSGSTAGLYRVLSAQSISGSFASVTGDSAAYQVITSATTVDYQQRAVLGAVTVNNPVVSIITGGSAAFTYTVANSAVSGGASLGFSSGSLSANLAGASSGTALAGGSSESISGLVFTGTAVGAGQSGTFGITAPTAFGETTATGTVSVNVLNHSLSSFESTDTASLSLDFGTYDNGTWTGGGGGNGSLGFTLWNIASDGFLAADTAGLALYDVIFTSGTNVFGTTLANFANLTAGTSNGYTASVLTPGSLDQGTYQGVYTLKFRDQQNLSGAANTRDLTLTMNVIVVPEPGSIALATIGIGFAGWLARRRGASRP